MITYSTGMTTVQLMLKTDDDEEESSAFVEYHMIPDLPESDEEIADAGDT